ncbi:MAG: hypothetical protein PVS3B3_31210 [Ktedonobacteraceae bacterium]
MKTEKYVSLADVLRKDILAGKYGSEGGLPIASELAKQYKMALNTAKRALSLLEDEGIIQKRGAAYHVGGIDVVMTKYSPPSHQRYSGFNRNLTAVEKVLLPEHLVAKLRTPQNQFVVSRAQVAGEFVRSKELPLQISYRYYFLPISTEKMQRMQDDATFDPMWQDAPIDLVSHEEVTSRPATSEELGHLSLNNPASILSLLEVIRDEVGNILMAQEIALSPRITLVFDFPFENKP